jgi:hypothetical protein
MKLYPVLGIYGKARSGKDTIGNYLAEKHGFYRTAFATYPKHILIHLYDLSYEQMFGDKLKEEVDARYGCSPRYIMQYWLQACRHIDPNIWIRICKKTIEGAIRSQPVVVTDMRFKDEAKMIAEMGGHLIKVEKDGASASGGIENHISEHDLDDWASWDLVIDNNGTLEQLYNQVENFLRGMDDRREWYERAR